MENKNKLASEIIADLKMELVLMDGKIESLYEEISQINSMFKAVHYTAVEGAISISEADAAMSGIESMLKAFLENMQDAMKMSNEIVDVKIQN